MRQKKRIPFFDSWLFQYTLRNPTSSFDDALVRYIKKFNIVIRHELDEPEDITLVRTKIQIFESSIFGDRTNMTNDSVQNIIIGLKVVVAMYDGLPPEGKNLYKASVVRLTLLYIWRSCPECSRRMRST